MNNEIQFILYQLPEGEGKVQVVIKDETIWATQKAMAQLFDVGVSDISKHLKKKYETGELERESTISKMETVVNRGFRGEIPEQVDFYSLDAIIAVGYRVSSVRATQFRKWATKVLKEFIKKAIEDEHASSKVGLIETMEVFSLVYDPTAAKFYLTLCYADGKTSTLTYDKFEYCDWKDGDTDETVKWTLADVTEDIINDIEGYVPSKLQAE